MAERRSDRQRWLAGAYHHSAMGTWPAHFEPWDVGSYIREEVRRQGHDINDPFDGIPRVQWMTDAWDYAFRARNLRGLPDIEDVVQLGSMVEPHLNEGGFRHCYVQVGNRICPEPSRIPNLVGALVDAIPDLPPLQWYYEFELIHPYRDGNGRTGKILLNWLAGTLEAPRFPPGDLFGGWIANP